MAISTIKNKMNETCTSYLFQAIRPSRSEAALRRFQALAQKFPPQKIVTAALEFGVAPLVYAHATARPRPTVSTGTNSNCAGGTNTKSIAQALEAQYHAAIASSVLLESAYKKVSDVLTTKEIPFLPLKGWDLSRRVYAQRETRTMGDLDILVRERDLRRTVSALKSNLSARRHSGPGEGRSWANSVCHDVVTLQVHKKPVVVEVHKHFARKHLVTARLEGLWERSITCNIADAHTTENLLSPEDCLLITAFHLSRSLFEFRPVWLLDLQGIVETMPIDWAQFVRRAREWNCATAVWFALDRSQTVVGEPFVPGPIMDHLRPPAVARNVLLFFAPRRLLNSPITKMTRREAQLRVLLPLMDNWQQRLRFFGEYAKVRLVDKLGL